MSEFNLEKRAEELFRCKGASPITFMGNDQAAITALQLARELAEAIAVECEGLGAPNSSRRLAGGDCAAIARSFVRPRTHEDVYREALERIVNPKPSFGGGGDDPKAVAKKALDWRQP